MSGAAEIEARALLAKRANDPTFDRDKAERWLTAAGARGGFEVVPLSADFRAASAAGRELWNRRGELGYGHWNAAGHAVAAEAMRRYFEPRVPGEPGGSPAPGAAAPAPERPRPVSR
jgi:hypothetical protein